MKDLPLLISVMKIDGTPHSLGTSVGSLKDLSG